MGGNLPPGVSHSHDYFNPPDMSHDHEWRPVDDAPILEDGAVIFQEECIWENVQNTEPGYEGERVVTESIPCEETRNIRFEPSYIWFPSGRGAPARDLPGMSFPMPTTEKALLDVEQAAQEGNVEITTVNPSPNCGKVRVEWNGHTVIYRP